MALAVGPACDDAATGDEAAAATGSSGAESAGEDDAADDVADDGGGVGEGSDGGDGGGPDDGVDDGPGDAGDDGAGDDDTGSGDDGAADGDDTDGEAYVCDPPIGSVCGNGNSILQGRVRLGDAMTSGATTGDLHVMLAHRYLGGGSTGGVPHWSEMIPAVDLAAGPVEWELDMCKGGEMWSEENCGYQLIVILDQNGNNATSFLPDAGEPSTVYELDISCGGPAPCLDLVLDCADGAACTQFTDPDYCSCGASHTCGSPIAAC